MTGIPFFTRFKRYTPSQEVFDELSSCVVTKTDADTELRAVRCYIDCDKIFTKSFLHAVEEEIKTAYDLRIVELCPHYPGELFSEEYIPELWQELKHRKLITNGFVDYDSITYDKEENLCKIAINYDGRDMLESSGIKETLVSIIKDEFDIRVKVELSDGRACLDENSQYKIETEAKYRRMIEENLLKYRLVE